MDVKRDRSFEAVCMQLPPLIRRALLAVDPLDVVVGLEGGISDRHADTL